MAKLSEAIVKGLKAGSDKRDIWDDSLPGFCVRVQPTGAKTYYIKYRVGGKQRWLKIGSASTYDYSAAHTRAKKAFRLVEDGSDPAAVKERTVRQAGQTFGDAIVIYLAKLEAERVATYHRQADGYLTKMSAGLHRMPVSGVTRADVVQVIKHITDTKGKISANRARSTLSAFFGWAIGEGYDGLESNPVQYTNKHAEAPRKRKLSHAELKAIWHKAPHNQFGDIVRLLMLTMQRRTEIGGLMTEEFNRTKRQIELSPERTKNGDESHIPLCDVAFQLLSQYYDPKRKFIFGREDTGYSGWSKSKKELDAILGFKTGWTLHDFRRTGKSAMEQDLDPAVPDNVSEAILNHAKQGLAKVYNGADYIRQKRDALDRYAAHLAAAGVIDGGTTSRRPRLHLVA